MDNYTQRPASERQPRRPAAGQPKRGSGSSGQQPRQPRQSTVKKKQKAESRWFRAILMVIGTIALCIFLSIFILDSANDLLGLNQEDQQYAVVIPQNTSIQQVSEILFEYGVVKQPITFSLYAGLKAEDEDMQPGEYLFNSNMGYDEIISALRTGDIQKEEVKLTFIEGWTIVEIAQHLEENNVCDAQEFLDYLDNEELTFSFMDELPLDNSNRFRRLEGYVFPDTYDFFVNETVGSVARKFLVNFEERVTTDMRNRMQDLNLSLDEAITLASVIQKEASSDHGIDEMKRVSSVFHNRLNLSAQYPKLQSDVTLFYVNNYIKPYQTYVNQEMYDSYNTYQCDGLPVAPICNPGLEAIEATLYPADTQYYFFVTDVQGQFYYSNTAQEHYQKVYQAAQVDGEGELHGTATVSD